MDCETGSLVGEPAFYRLLHWGDGEFVVEFGPVERQARISISTRSLLLEGMRRLDEWSRLAEQMPPPDRVLEVDGELLSRRLGEIPDDVNATLRLVDGRRTLQQVVEDSGRDDLGAAAVISRLYFEGILREASAAGSSSAAAPVEPAGPTPEPGGVDWFAGPVEPTVTRLPSSAEPAAGPAAREAANGPPSPPPSLPVAEATAAPAAVASPPAAEPRTGAPASAGARARRPVPPPAAEPVEATASWGTLVVWALVVCLLVVVVGGVALKHRRTQREIAAAAEAAAAAPAEEPPPPEPAIVPAPVPPAVDAEPAAVAEAAPAGAAYREAFDRAGRRYQAGDFAAAAADYRRALGVQETSEALAGLGRALYDARRPGEALEALDRAVALDAANGDAWLALGEVHLSRGERAEARAAYRRYLEVAPGGAHADEVRQVLQRLR